jgi:hypothetical protein
MPPVFEEGGVREGLGGGCGNRAMIPLLGSLSHCVMLKGQAYRQYIPHEFGRAFDVGEEEGDYAGG